MGLDASIYGTYKMSRTKSFADIPSQEKVERSASAPKSREAGKYRQVSRDLKMAKQTEV